MRRPATLPDQGDLFAPAALAVGPRRVELAPGIEVLHVPGWLEAAEATQLLAHVLASMRWEQRRIGGPIGGTPLPRLTAWCGCPGAVYSYSGITHLPQPWTPPLRDVHGKAFAAVRAKIPWFQGWNGCLLNRYRGEEDSVGWHRDDEVSLGELDRVIVASVSLGATRRFQLRAQTPRAAVLEWSLGHGDLFVMGPGVQTAWEHAAPKERVVVGERVSLNFRRVNLSPNRSR